MSRAASVVSVTPWADLPQDPLRKIAVFRRIAVFDLPGFGDELVNALVGGKRVEPQHQRRAVGRMLGVILQLLAIARDEFIRIAHDDDFPAAKHGEAAQVVEHLGQLGFLAVEVAALRIRRQRRQNVSQLLQLQKGLGADQSIDGFGDGRFGHA